MSKFKFELIGHDVELIARDEVTGEPVSCAEFVQETLDSCMVYPDNVLLEINTDPVPLDEFVTHINQNKVDVEYFLNECGLKTVWGEAEAEYPQHELCNKQAHAIGCQPFGNAYLLGVPLTPTTYNDNWRYAGGHVHLAYDKNLVPSHYLVKMLDEKFKKVQMKDHKNPRRDSFYGQMGAYREKSYGIEYRSLNNDWFNNPQWIIDGLLEIEAEINEVLK